MPLPNQNCIPSDDALKALIKEYLQPSSIQSGDKDVAVPGTAEAIVAVSTPCLGVWITGKSDNTGGAPVTVGDENTVDGAEATRKGTPVYPGQTIYFMISDASLLWIDSENGGDGVTFNISK